MNTIYENVSCSQCGRDFGSGAHGYSHCSDHTAQAEAIQLGREWLANSPPFDGVHVGPDFMSGIVGCVCRSCCRRIVGRGCDLKRIANVPTWEATSNDVCDLCDNPVLQ